MAIEVVYEEDLLKIRNSLGVRVQPSQHAVHALNVFLVDKELVDNLILPKDINEFYRRYNDMIADFSRSIEISKVIDRFMYKFIDGNIYYDIKDEIELAIDKKYSYGTMTREKYLQYLFDRYIMMKDIMCVI